MALDKTRLTTAIRANVVANMDASWPTTGLDTATKAQADQQREEFAAAIASGVADAVIDEFKNHAEIATALSTNTITVASVGGVTTGPGVSGPGLGSIDNGAATGGIS